MAKTFYVEVKKPLIILGEWYLKQGSTVTGMKVKHIGEKEVSVPNYYKIFLDVIPNKIYEVLAVEKGWYLVD